MPDLPAPGFKKHPDFKSEIAPADKTFKAYFEGELIAESARALVLCEVTYPPVVYFPRADVRLDLLSPTGHHTHCPFKGDACYWTIHAGGKTAENAVWSYEDPFREAQPIKDHLAFYANVVEITG